MDAKTVLEMMERGIYPADNSEFWKTCRDALRLLAAAEANDGARSQLIEDLRTEADLCRNETAEDIAELLDDAASSIIAISAMANALKDERNGLAARVRELEGESAVNCLAVNIETELCAQTAEDAALDFPEDADEPRTGPHVGDYWNGFRMACEEIATRIRLRHDAARSQ